MFSRSKLNFAIFQGVPIFKSSPQPNAPTDFLQTIRFGKLKVHGFQKYMSAKVPGGGRVSISGPQSNTIYHPAEGQKGLLPALKIICRNADAAAAKPLIVLSDRNVGKLAVYVPALLILGAVHQHLIK